jgi:hypothetical protein
MKKILSPLSRCTACVIIFFLTSVSSYANHIKGAELRYKWISGLTYQISVYLYGDCSSPLYMSSTSYYTLPVSKPVICIFNGNTYISSIILNIADTNLCGAEIPPPCPDSSAYTTCTNLSYTIPGIEKFIYTTTYTFPSSQKYWRMIYNGNNGSGGLVPSACTGNPIAGSFAGAATAGRSYSITNLAPGSILELIDTLNTTTSRGHNSNPVLSNEPLPFFCAYNPDCYDPGAIDLYDTDSYYGRPSGDSLVFSLVQPYGGSGSSCIAGSPVSYTAGMDAWTTPSVQPVGAATPIQCSDGASFSFNATTGRVCFEPITQTSALVYNIAEYFHDTLTGTMQREMNFYVKTCDHPCPGIGPTTKVTSLAAKPDMELYPNPASTQLNISETYNITGIVITNMMGQVVYRQNYSSPVVQIDITDLRSGVYLITINGATIRRFTKQDK